MDEARELAGRRLGATAPRSQRLEVICQEYLGSFPGQGGSDEEWNRTALCPPHHLRGVPMGYVRVSGRAPDQLV